MRKIMDNCACCNQPCINCDCRHEEVLYCDNCNDSKETLYEYWGDELCEDCLINRLIEDFILTENEKEAIKNINTLFNAEVITEKGGKYYLDKDFSEVYSYNEVIEAVLFDVQNCSLSEIANAWNFELVIVD